MARSIEIHDGPPPPKARPEFISRQERREVVSAMRPGQWFRCAADERDRVIWLQASVEAGVRISTWRHNRSFIYRRDS